MSLGVNSSNNQKALWITGDSDVLDFGERLLKKYGFRVQRLSLNGLFTAKELNSQNGVLVIFLSQEKGSRLWDNPHENCFPQMISETKATFYGRLVTGISYNRVIMYALLRGQPYVIVNVSNTSKQANRNKFQANIKSFQTDLFRLDLKHPAAIFEISEMKEELTQEQRDGLTGIMSTCPDIRPVTDRMVRHFHKGRSLKCSACDSFIHCEKNAALLPRFRIIVYASITAFIVMIVLILAISIPLSIPPAPTGFPTRSPQTTQPSFVPSTAPSFMPSRSPTTGPSRSPSRSPTSQKPFNSTNSTL